ncbi:5'-3' exonuclease [Catelliglobosispora koreensis]|uniref:5'-3' exonuclease n=1 Tax=Catelliglobosispora koreensis TaxID=129052 RepID=UPI00035E20B4|nr:5'-3' exonuclease H3TH domain-containing protein [Catelliglobosispora koreensis]
MPATRAPLLLVADGNSLLHHAHHAAAIEGARDHIGRPVWALKGLVGYLARAAAQLRPDAVIVGFDCPDYSARKAQYPPYRASRRATPKDLAHQIVEGPDLLWAAGVCTVSPPAFEASDALASCAEQARLRGWQSVLLTADRDAFALINESTSVIRIRNGGFDSAVMVDAPRLVNTCGVQPWQYRDYSALRGEPSDNLHGVSRFRAATAARLLNVFGTVDAAWATIDRGDTQSVRAAVGELAAEQLGIPEARDIVDRNRSLMNLRVALPMPKLETAMLPLDPGAVNKVLSSRGIELDAPLWALTSPADPAKPTVEKPPAVRKARRKAREQIPGQLSLFEING